MTASIPQRKHWTLEQLVSEIGPVQLLEPMTKAAFLEFAGQFPNLQIEREPNGTTIVISPVKKGSSRRENRLSFLLNLWNQQSNLGEVFGPNGTYDLPDGAIKMPDVSWIALERMAGLPEDEEQFIQIVPDFVVEIRSASDNLAKLQQKMTDSWIANGVRLAWLIDPYAETAYVYRPGQEIETVQGFADQSLHGGEVLPGFELPLREMMRRS